MDLGSLVANVIRIGLYPTPKKKKRKQGFSIVTHKLVSSSSQNINPKSYTDAKSLHLWHYQENNFDGPPPKLRNNYRYPRSHRGYKARQKWVTTKVGNRNFKHPMGMHSRDREFFLRGGEANKSTDENITLGRERPTKVG